MLKYKYNKNRLFEVEDYVPVHTPMVWQGFAREMQENGTPAK